MIIIKIILTFLVVLSALAILAVFADSLTSSRYCWLHDLTEYIISALACVVLLCIIIGLILIYAVGIYEIWTL